MNETPAIIAILLFSEPVCFTNFVTSAKVEPSLFKTTTEPLVTGDLTDVLAATSETNFFNLVLVLSDNLDKSSCPSAVKIALASSIFLAI